MTPTKKYRCRICKKVLSSNAFRPSSLICYEGQHSPMQRCRKCAREDYNGRYAADAVFREIVNKRNYQYWVDNRDELNRKRREKYRRNK